jgi:hypothetical protein
MTKNNKATKVIRWLEKHPKATNADIAETLGVSAGYVWKLRRLGLSTVKAPVEPLTSEQVKVSVDAILDKRASTYGNFVDVARITQRLKHVAHTAAGERDKTFAYDQAEAMDMIFSKLARIINGDANHIDSWLDIAGYAKLVSDRLEALARGLPK